MSRPNKRNLSEIDAPETDVLEAGSTAPSFALPDQDGVVRTLDSFSGRWVLLYFYPKDMTPGCTIEAEGFREIAHDLAEAGVEVVGISADAVKRHKTFCEKHELPFTLLSDTNKETLAAYGVLGEKTLYGKRYIGIMRESFLIDERGIILKRYRAVKPLEHPREVLRDVVEMRSLVRS